MMFSMGCALLASATCAAAAVTQGRVRLDAVPSSGLVELSSIDGHTYRAATFLGGATFNLTVDTGATDTWIPSAQPVDSGRSTVTLPAYNVSGVISSASVALGGYSANVNFAEIDNASNPLVNPGALGLGPPSGSVFPASSSGSLSQSLLTNRSATPAVAAYFPRNGTGALAFGGTLPNYTNITSQPVLKLANAKAWTTALDAQSVTLGGGPVSLPDSTVTGSGGAPVVAFDSTSVWSFVPSNVSQQLYANVTGAFFDENAGAWRVPCETEMYVALAFGGVNFTMHPLDAVLPRNNWTTACFGSLAPINNTTRNANIADIVLGTPFLHNAALLLSFGSPASLQLLPTTTNMTQAHDEFVAARGATTATTSPPPSALSPPHPTGTSGALRRSEAGVMTILLAGLSVAIFGSM